MSTLIARNIQLHVDGKPYREVSATGAAGTPSAHDQPIVTYTVTRPAHEPPTGVHAEILRREARRGRAA